MVLEFLQDLAAYGYGGVFAISLVGSATIIFPVPYFVIIFGLATVLNPVLLTIVSGVGSALGEFLSFYVGKYGSHLILKKHGRWFRLAEKWFKRNGFLTLVFLAAAPGVADIGGLMAGALHYSRLRFLIANLIGKIAKFAVIVYAGYYSLPIVMQYLGIA